MEMQEEKSALSRMVDYCREEAAELEMPFVVYCLSMAKASLEQGGKEIVAGVGGMREASLETA